MAERRKQGLEFRQLDQSVNKKKRKEWRALMDAWVKDSTQQNPFLVEGGRDAGPSEHAVAEDLKKTELEEMRAGRAPLFEAKMSVTAFVRAGLQLEETQRRIKAALKNKTLTATRGSEIQEMRVSLLKQMQTFERLQLTYMPGVEGLREEDEAARDSSDQPLKAEELKLYLPSNLTSEERKLACVPRVVETEAELRVGQCADALTALRVRLHAKLHLLWFRDANWVGQRAWTRSSTLTSRLDEVVDRIVAKYRAAHTAGVDLKGSGFPQKFRALVDSDVSLRMEEVEKDLKEDKKKQKPVSWIWLADAESDKAEMHDCELSRSHAFTHVLMNSIVAVRVEWSKARARKTRWNEEVELTREEMKRVLRSLRWAEGEWQQRADRVRDDVEAEVAEGLRAYALRQVAIHRRIAASFYADWEKTRDATWANTEDMEFFINVMDGTGGADEEGNDAVEPRREQRG
ncbi:CxC2 domain-containing protein [Mycena chlorophos]|uniref:CxC2 domain-containing protein n=1 Tax=Mycena chlorophos TaxID=658473 RepID=A0A8H6TJ62_MYCCL|nr:CxC2 domain-containing protein [Mycena chlorophos]